MPNAPLSRQGRLFVVSGPSGVGKDTVLDRLFRSARKPPELTRIVTATTRARRLGERNGVHYRFLARDAFLEMARKGGFLEHAEFAGHLYGTPRDAVNAAKEGGNDCLLKIDIQGGLAVRKAEPDAVLIFLAAPSSDALLKRLMGRGDISPEDLAQRWARYEEEVQAAKQYDYLVVNEEGAPDKAMNAIATIIRAERFRVRKEKWGNPGTSGQRSAV